MTRAEKEWEVYSGKYRTYIKTERGLAANTVEAYMRDLRRFRRFVTERYRLSPLEVETPVVEVPSRPLPHTEIPSYFCLTSCLLVLKPSLVNPACTSGWLIKSFHNRPVR